jgi:hypothetical protein
MPSLHMPLQSGSDEVLRRMRRSYRSTKFLGILDRVREAIPTLGVSAIASITSSVKAAGCGEVNLTLSRPSMFPQARSSPVLTRCCVGCAVRIDPRSSWASSTGCARPSLTLLLLLISLSVFRVHDASRSVRTDGILERESRRESRLLDDSHRLSEIFVGFTRKTDNDISSNSSLCGFHVPIFHPS